MPTPIHSKIINKVARNILKEHGIVRKGQSRSWHDDQYWFTTVIEFQPFKDKKGTCLNVGVNFHWYFKNYFSFDIGYRESEFIVFVNEEQFENEIHPLVELALNKTLELREKLSNLKTATNTILNHHFTSDRLWGNYHRAIICGLNNESKKSRHYFDKILKKNMEHDWELELKKRVEKLQFDLEDSKEFHNRINQIIKETRKEKKLKETDIKYVW